MATSRNFKQFHQRIILTAKVVGTGATKIVRKAAVAMDTTAAMTTPVDTGRAWGNWRTSIGSPLMGETGALGPSAGPDAVLAGMAVIATWKPGMGAIYVANSVPYIKVLDEGHSRQAPQGMTRFALAAAKRELRKGGLLK